MRTNYDEELHEDFVNLVCSILKQKGFNRICSALANDSMPPRLNGFLPDVYAEKVKKNLIGLPSPSEIMVVIIETKDATKEPETVSKRRALSKWARENDARFKMVIAR